MIQDIDANGKIPDGYGIYSDSLQVAKTFKKRHAEIVKIIMQLENDLKDDSWLFKSLFEGVVFIKKQMKYREQKYFVYGMSEKEYWLVITKIKTKEALRDSIVFINRLLLTQKEATEGKFYKNIFHLQAALAGAKEGNEKEIEFHKEIVLNFDKIFPNYDFVQSEYPLPDGDRIDILAKEKITERDVIMEIKTEGKSAHKQLRSYAYHFNKPILVNITRKKVINKREDIIYINIPLKKEGKI